MGEDECGAGDVADFAGAGGDVLEGAPALVEQGEPAFAEAAQGALDGVAGAGVDIEVPPAGGLFDRDMDADAGAVVAGVGESGQTSCGGGVERGESVQAGGGEVVYRAGFGGRDPQREPARGEHGLDVAAVGVCLPGVPQVDDLAFHADGGFFAPVGRDDLPVQDHVRKSLAPGPLQRVGQARGPGCQHGDDLVDVAVGGSPGDAVVAGQCVGGGAVAEPPQRHHGLPKTGQCPAAAWGAAAAALSGQQLRGELHQFPGNVERGTIGDHVEPSVEGDLWRDLLLLGSTPISGQPHSSACLLGYAC